MMSCNAIESCSSESSNSDIQFLNRRGGKVLLHGGYQYHKKKVYKNGSSIWQCSTRKKYKCTGSITIQCPLRILKTAMHTTSDPQKPCNPDFGKNIVAETIEAAKEYVKVSTSPIPKIFKDKIQVPLKDKGLHLVGSTPLYGNKKTLLYNTRKQSLGVSKCVFSDVREVEIPVKFTSFLLADFCYNDNRILIFSTKESRELMPSIKEVFCDGTFSSCPPPFLQLFTIFGNLDESLFNVNMVPLCYALLKNKKEETYFALFEILKSRFPDWKPTKFHIDFEVSSSNAILKAYPDATIKKCYYHMTRSIWRRAKKIGIKQKLEKRIVELCAVLPLLPERMICDGWKYIVAQFPTSDKLKKFQKYMESYWLKEGTFINQWCVYNERHRTTNVLEAWHSKLNKNINKNYVTMLKLLSFIQNETTTFSKRLQCYIERDQFIIESQLQLIHDKITVGHFLEKLR